MIAELCARFAQDSLSMTELERRLDLACRATGAAELSALLADLPTANVPAAGASPGQLDTALARERQIVAAVMASTVRRGRWSPARQLAVVACMGSVQLDFRQAEVDPGGIEVNVLAIMGGIEIIVPPGMVVQTEVIPLMGGVDHRGAGSDSAVSGMPVIRIRGAAVMGGIEISERRPGESGRDARRRIRDARRHHRDELLP